MLSLGGGNGGNGQSLEDKLYAIKYFISGQGISFVVLKATTSELLGPKKKHLTYLVTMTNEPNVSIPNLVKYLMQRALHPDWPVAFKALITIHHLMSYGNEKFLQNLASSTVNDHIFNHLSSFDDKSTSLAYDMSIFVRRYSRYVACKIKTYRLLGMDFCKIKANGLIEPSLRVRSPSLDQLMKILPPLQSQFDFLIAFDASDRDLKNGIINSAFSSLYKDFVKLYITYQSVIIRLLKLYFTVSKVKRAQELLDVYKKFLVRMDKMSDFLRVIDLVGMNKSDLPYVSKWPNLPLKQLEDHANQLESPSKLGRVSKNSSEALGMAGLASVVSPKLSQLSTNSNGRRQSFRQDSALSTSSKLFKSSTSSSKQILKKDATVIEALEFESKEKEKKTQREASYCDTNSVKKASSMSANKIRDQQAAEAAITCNQKRINEMGSAGLIAPEECRAKENNDSESKIEIEQQDLMLLDDEPIQFPFDLEANKKKSISSVMVTNQPIDVPTRTISEAATSNSNWVQAELL